MRNSNFMVSGFILFGMLLGLALMAPDFAMAAGGSFEEQLEALADSKGGGDPGVGHGIEAGVQAVQANRAEKAAKAAEQKRVRMEEEAKQQDAYLAANCDCPHGEYADGRCASGLIIRETCYSADHRREIPCAPMGEDERQASAEAKAEKHRLCAEWRAQGPKANSAAFKAQLAQQYAAIDASKRKWEEEDRKRNEMIRDDDRRAQEQAVIDMKAKDKAEQDAENSRRAAQKAKADTEEAARVEKLHQWCLTGNNMGYCQCWRWAPKGGNACMK